MAYLYYESYVEIECCREILTTDFYKVHIWLQKKWICMVSMLFKYYMHKNGKMFREYIAVWWDIRQLDNFNSLLYFLYFPHFL
jgi:hypothetical protein